MGKVIKVQPYADGVEASCKWNNRRLYVFYNHEVNTFIFGIKSYSNKKGVNSFCTVTSNRGIHAMEFALSLETFGVLVECQNAIVEYMRGNIKDKKDNKDK